MSTSIHSTKNPATNTPVAPPPTELPTKSDPLLIKKKELAKRLSVSPHTIDAWVQRREIPCIKVTPRLYLYDVDAVMQAIRKKYAVQAV